MLKPSATKSQIVEESDGCVVHEDMNSVQEPQSENHDMDQWPMSKVVDDLEEELVDTMDIVIVILGRFSNWIYDIFRAQIVNYLVGVNLKTFKCPTT